ncbi:ABC transporter substrate-binding protein [Paenibacillus glacialis]|nr:ABC transporter substrate-binding protein [Paenibacillus glacialis]
MEDRLSKDRIPYSHTYYLPVSISNWEETLITTDEEMASCPCVLVVSNGNGLLTLNEQQYALSRGCVVLWHNSNELKLSAQLHTRFEGILIRYRCLNSDGAEPNVLKYPEPLWDCSLNIISLTAELEKVSRNLSNSKPFHFQQLFVELLSELSEEIERRLQQTGSWMEQVLHYIDTHFHEDVTREQMATLAQVSPEHFSRAFRRHTGQTFSAYLAMLRIRTSQNRLLFNMPKLENLAQEVGYKEGNYLSRKFKQLVGLSPTAYHHKQKRVVTLNSNHTACLLALGITPELGVYSSWIESVKHVNPVQKLYECGGSASSFYETVAAAHPDVIIDYNTAKGNNVLLPLAPVLGLSFMNISWREQFRLIADIVERQWHVEEWLAHYDELICSFNQKLDQRLCERGTAVVWEIGTSSAYCINSSYGRGSQILYEDIGFRPPVSLLKHGIDRWGYVEEEIEAIVDYPADHIFITGLPSNLAAKKRMNRLFRSEPWLKMEAVKKNRVYVIDKPDLFYGYDPLSSQAQLHELMRLLTLQN